MSKKLKDVMENMKEGSDKADSNTSQTHEPVDYKSFGFESMEEMTQAALREYQQRHNRSYSIAVSILEVVKEGADELETITDQERELLPDEVSLLTILFLFEQILIRHPSILNNALSWQENEEGNKHYRYQIEEIPFIEEIMNKIRQIT